MQTELLAPGGSLEGMKAAIAAGADAVYMGGMRFGARAYADNPDQDGLLEAIDYCHLHGKKLYLTVNTLLKEEELTKELYEYLLPVYRQGVDAVLVQDMGVFRLIRREFPDLAVHASTQMSVQSPEGARFFYDQGMSRIVPARELSLEEVREIHRQCPVEIETFVHGALCYCYSGQCLMSSLIGGRSGNRGRCAQPCRQKYTLPGGNGRPAGRGGEYLLSLKDICTLDVIPDLVEAGICSFKIEGRMKQPSYAAGVTGIYRRYIDRYLKEGAGSYRVDDEDRRMLADLYCRGGFSSGYYISAPGPEMMSMQRPNHAGTRAVRIDAFSGKNLTGTALEQLWPGDVLVTGKDPKGNDREITVDRLIMPGETVRFPAAAAPHSGRKAGRADGEEIWHRVRCRVFLEDVKNRWMVTEISEKIKGKFILASGEPVILELQKSAGKPGKTVRVRAFADVPSPARTRGLTTEEIRRQLMKTGGSPFCFEKLEISAEEGLFLSVGQLNALRREALKKLELALVEACRRPAPVRTEPEVCVEEEKANAGQTKADGQTADPVLCAAVETPQQLRAVLKAGGADRILLDSLYYMDHPDEDWRAAAEEVGRSGAGVILMLPPVWQSKARTVFRQVFADGWQEAFDGCMLRCLDQLGMPEISRMQRWADARLYTWNREAAAFFRENDVKLQVLPLEENAAELMLCWRDGGICQVYGRAPVMTSAQCLRKNTGSCRKQPDVLRLKDRTGAEFPVRTHCGICINTIYNSLPLDLSGYSRKVGGLGCRGVLFSFTVEDAQQTEDTMRRLLAVFRDGKEAGPKDGRSTNGHFMRGVE